MKPISDLTRRSLFRYLVGVAAGTVLARMPLAGAYSLQRGEVLTPQERFNLTGLFIPFIPVVEDGQFRALAECVGCGFRIPTLDAMYLSDWVFACPACGIRAKHPLPWRAQQ